MKKYFVIAVVFFSLFLILAGCASVPENKNPLAYTKWEWVNEIDATRYVVEYSDDMVSFTIFNENGSVYQEPVSGKYSLSENILTEIYGDFTTTSILSGNSITDSSNSTIIFIQQN
jgi:hypothetical protein